jgi:putative transcriptional regulator
MSEKAFSKVMRGLEEANDYMQGKRQSYKVTVPVSVDVKSIRKGLNMTQAAFSDSFGFSLDTVKHWEGGRRTPEVPARAYLTVIQRNPSAVLKALHPASADARSQHPTSKRKA